MASNSNLSLRWLYLAVLGPLILLAFLAWIGIRSQLDAAWGSARGEAERLASSTSDEMGYLVSASWTAAPDFPDPPIPGVPSPKDEILDGSDFALLVELRDDPDAGISPAGIPRQALAGLRLRNLKMKQRDWDLAELLMATAPSVLTPKILPDLDVPKKVLDQWNLGERAMALAKNPSRSRTEGFTFVKDDRFWWIGIDQDNVHFTSFPRSSFPNRSKPSLPETEDTFRFRYLTGDQANGTPSQNLPPTAVLLAESSIATSSQPFLSEGGDWQPAKRYGLLPPETPSTPEKWIPAKNDLRLQVYAIPEILEAPIRRQQRWTLTILAAALLTAAISLIVIHRTVARERKLADLKSQFVASVSHELRAPLGSIRLMAESLQQERVSKPAEFHTLIAREGARLSHLIENVLDFARIEEGRKQYHFEECDLAALLRDTLRLMQSLAEDRRVHLAFDIPDLTATVDPNALQQALVNLIDNAIKFSPEGSSVDLRSTISQDGQVEIRITDHGPGIPKREHQNIFKRFHRLGNELRRETQGTGIGLSIVKHIVEAHGGTITVDSTPPNGTTFTLTLPQHHSSTDHC